ncbi:MAG: LPS export ABC transporter periplasmic protein LptC [Alphaproteobacteria bacterium]|nr:LPS export ABC transporter periplasmic protein LptC [Alphaproteobacteria bacterium]
MFETQKIDTFFSGENNLLDEEEKIFISRRTKVVRFFKLFLPCLTALLLGLGVVLFDFESNSDSTFSLAEEEKIYFEKFRMKNTTFEITEKDNQYSVLKAEVVEEINPNSKIYDLTMPQAQTLDKDKTMSVTADTGVYDQNKQNLNLKKNVVGNYNGTMDITTNSASYNFRDEKGFGNEQIIGKGENSYLKADKFTFDKKNSVVTLIGHVYLQKDDMELRSPDKAKMFFNESKFVSSNALVQKGKDSIKSDELVVFFKDTKNFEISKAHANGHAEIYNNGKKAFADRAVYDAEKNVMKLFSNVKIIDDSGYTASGDEGIFDNDKKIFTLKSNVFIKDKSGYTATAKKGIYDLNKKTFSLLNDVQINKDSSVIKAPKAIYFQAKDEFRLYDKVHITQEDGTAEAKSGVYYIKKNMAELENNVVLTKKGNQVRGDKAISDFTTSKSRLIAKNGRRIFGKLYESSFKKDSKDK